MYLHYRHFYIANSQLLSQLELNSLSCKYKISNNQCLSLPPVDTNDFYFAKFYWLKKVNKIYLSGKFILLLLILQSFKLKIRENWHIKEKSAFIFFCSILGMLCKTRMLLLFLPVKWLFIILFIITSRW